MFGGVPRGQGEQPYNHEGGPYGLATGGRAGFADGGDVKWHRGHAPTAEQALGYRLLSGSQNIRTLTAAFDKAIAHHTSLSDSAREANSKDAEHRVGRFTSTKSGIPDLLQKNAKMMKSEKGIEGKTPIQLPDGRGVETTGLALAPAYQENGFGACSNFQSCYKSCLGLTSGGNWMFGGGKDLNALKGPRLAHFKNTMAMLGDPEAFAVKLYDEVEAAKYLAARNGNKLGVRLNVLSDIAPRIHAPIINGHPDVDFYDYTKSDAKPIAPNHHYTYSSTGLSQPEIGVENPHQNWSRMRRKLDQGHNVAMPFSVKGRAGDDKLPKWLHDQESGKHYQVIDGDTHDYRPMDRVEQPADPAAPRNPGVIVGLRNKAQNTHQATAAAQTQGFFVHHDPKAGSASSDWASVVRRQNVVNVAPQTKAHAALTNDMTVDPNQ
jgi:hypothetical protein